ncbi:MAG TPA: translocation/assembly module TamB domain-containing protein, partial [Prolixibacteraceae bacterium]|nr:translocation/assembly module TamB domain-containing protein [Prolixibacteraceae bacterium]
EFRNQSFGNVSLVNFWDRNTESIRGDISIRQDNRTTLSGSGYFQPKNMQLDFLFDLNNQSIGFMNALIRETFSNFHGDGSGRVRVSGTPDKLLMDGAVFCKNAGLTIDYTQVSYLLNDSVRFAGDKIIFDKIAISDITGNKGVFDGYIRHDTFRNMDYNMSVSSGKILAFNTAAKDNDIFYGKALASGRMTITGHNVDVKLGGEFTTLPETSVTIVLADETEVPRYDFVRFVSSGKSDNAPAPAVTAPTNQGLEIDLIIHATPEAKAQMIYNTQITDIIRAQGEGTIRFAMDKSENVFLYGSYTVEQGEYLFTLQDVIRKRFTVENGGSITWSGDPYNAVIDLKALYKLKASLYELMVTSLENANTKQRIPVDCQISLTGDLMRPDITLNILFPQIDEQIRDELQQFFSTQEDMNRQMVSLLVLGKFYTPDFVRGNYVADNSGLIGNTASDLFSNQLSNWLSQINKDVNVGINYRPGNQLTNDEIEFALSTQILNDRVRINGNIGNNTNPAKATNSELVGDFEIEVKLTQNGKLQLKAYNRSNNNLIYETAPYTQGLGISYKEEYNTFGELWNKVIGLFRK